MNIFVSKYDYKNYDSKSKIIKIVYVRNHLLESTVKYLLGDERLIILDKYFLLKKTFISPYIYEEIQDYDIALLFFEINDRTSFEKIKQNIQYLKNINIKYLIGVYNSYFFSKRRIPLEEVKNFEEANRFNKYFEIDLFYDEQKDNLIKLIMSNYYATFYTDTVTWKLYETNNILNEFFSNHLSEEVFIQKIKKIFEKKIDFEQNLDENKILIETYTSYIKLFSSITIEQFKSLINKIEEEKIIKNFYLSCYVNNIILKGTKKYNNNEKYQILSETIIQKSIKKICYECIPQVGTDIIYNYNINNNVIFSYKKIRSIKIDDECNNYYTEIIPIEVSESNKKYNTELTSFYNRKIDCIKKYIEKYINEKNKCVEILKSYLTKNAINKIINNKEYDTFAPVNFNENFKKIYKEYKENNDLIKLKKNNYLQKYKIEKKLIYNEKKAKNKEKYRIFLEKESEEYKKLYIKLIKINKDKFIVITKTGIKLFSSNYQMISYLKMPISNYLILKNGNIIMESNELNCMNYIHTKTFKITKMNLLVMENCIPFFELEDNRIMFKGKKIKLIEEQEQIKSLYIYTKKGKYSYILSSYINQYAKGAHQINSDTIILFNKKFMLFYSTKNFELKKVLKNKGGNKKGFNYNETICIVYGSSEHVYLINRINFEMVSHYKDFNIGKAIFINDEVYISRFVKEKLYSDNMIDYGYVSKIKIYGNRAINEESNVYETNNIKLKDIIEINDEIVVLKINYKHYADANLLIIDKNN